MKIEIFSVQKTKDSGLAKNEEHFLRQLASTQPIQCSSVNKKAPASLPPEEVKKKEGQALLNMLTPADYLVALDEEGKLFNSLEFASWLEDHRAKGHRRLVLAIGGPHGWSDEVKQRANETLSLSPLTFNHQHARLVLIEQLYRAAQIHKGHPYHK